VAVGADPTSESALEAHSLYRFYRSGDEETLALQGVSLAVRSGEFVVITGPSGSGKSTLLACLAGMGNPDGGSVRIGGQRISHRPEPDRARIRARHIGMHFQNGNLIEHLSVAHNLSLVQSISGRGHKDGRDVLGSLGLQHRATAYPSQLSGGDLARAGLAVALANAPSVLLADEPMPHDLTVTNAFGLDSYPPGVAAADVAAAAAARPAGLANELPGEVTEATAALQFSVMSCTYRLPQREKH
jgi:putative ABC transport system ATP-binding protein